MLTLPLQTYEIVLGKFFAGVTIVLVSIFPSVFHFLTISFIGINVEYGIIACGYISLILTAAVYTAVGIFAGTISANQIVAFIVAFLIVIVFFLMNQILVYLPISWTAFLSYFSLTWQNANLIKGVIDTRVLVYFFSLIFVFLFFATTVLDARKR
jgi:ABC-2 type transport system permease protein